MGAAALLCMPRRVPNAQTAVPRSRDAAGAQAATSKIVSAANAFLATLTPQQRQSVQFAFNDEQQRARWSNFPTGFVRRAGLNLGDLTPPQRSAAMTLLSSVLSRRGMEKVQQIMEADEVLEEGRQGRPASLWRRRAGRRARQIEVEGRAEPQDGNGPPPFGGGGQGGPPPAGGWPGGPRQGRGNGPRPGGGNMFGKDLYYFSFLGTPSETTPWMLQFGGHHLALNLTIVGGRNLLTPSLTGAQPAMYTAGRKDGAPARPGERQGARFAQRAGRHTEETGDFELSCRRPCAWPRSGRQDHSARRPESVCDERKAARDAAGCDLGVDGHLFTPTRLWPAWRKSKPI